ncbi:hypothetical protein BDW67DRAFT_175317 [Aspergillus spinulosporus]
MVSKRIITHIRPRRLPVAWLWFPHHGANGCIDNVFARSFSRAGWIAYGLMHSEPAARSLQLEEILPVLGQIHDTDSHNAILHQLPKTLDAIVSTTENLDEYITHYKNTVQRLRILSLSSGRDRDLKPHTEESPLNPPDLESNRANMSLEIFENSDAFAPVLIRPTNIYGRSASYYRGIFEVAALAKTQSLPLQIPVPPASICHALHVDDCGDAYVALAAPPRRTETEGEIFKIYGREYETVDQIARALVAEYDLPKVEYVDPERSNRIRDITGWRDVRPPFSEAIGLCRWAHEAAVETEHEIIVKIVKGRRRSWDNSE